MKHGIGRLAALLTLTACASAPPQETATPPVVRLASAAEASAVLITPDDYLGALTPTDLSLKPQSPAPIDQKAYVAFLRAAVAEWTPQERARMEALFARHRAKLAELSPWLPEEVLVAKSGPKLEAGAAHTRGAAIFMGDDLPKDEEALDGLFFHELFHVLSRHNPSAHDALYAAVGYQPCPNAPAPAPLRESIITNPDAVVARHVIPLELEGANRLVMPLLLARPDRYDPAKGGGFFDYVSVELLEVERDARGACTPVLEGDAPRLFKGEAAMATLKAATGGNTNYLIHPEETTADTFVLLTLDRKANDLAPLDKLAEVLEGGPPSPSR